MDRWKFNHDGKSLIATPDIDKMSEFIAESVHALTIKCAQFEEREILKASSDDVLMRLRKAIDEVLEERKVVG